MSVTRERAVVGLEQALELYRRMTLIRLFEEQANELYRSAKMPGLTHLYIGEEAVAVGVCSALRRDDWITSTHRGHGHCLAKGAEPGRMFAELLGKEAGYCRGKGGSMHIADHENGNLGANAIVGGSAGIATGAALSAKRRGTDQVAVCFFGEGALGQGLVYEVMNMAALWTLPVVYVCENNLYNEYTHYLEATAGEILAPAARLRDRGAGGGRPGRARRLRRGRRARRAARRGDGVRPSCLRTPTATTVTTSATSTAPTTARRRRRSSGAASATRSRCSGAGSRTRSSRPPTSCGAIEDEARDEIERGLAFALEAPFPDPSQVTEDVYA